MRIPHTYFGSITDEIGNTTNVRNCSLAALLLAAVPPINAQDPVTRRQRRGQQEDGEAVRHRRLQGAAVLRLRHPSSPKKGHILTVNNHILNTPGILVHLYDGRQFQAKVLAREPELDVALLKIDEEVRFAASLRFRKRSGPAAWRRTATGCWRMSNQFKIALRDEPMSVQRGVIAAVADLRGRRGRVRRPLHRRRLLPRRDRVQPRRGRRHHHQPQGATCLGILGRELKDHAHRHLDQLRRADPGGGRCAARRQGRQGRRRQVRQWRALPRRSLLESTFRRPSTKREDKGGYHGIVLVQSLPVRLDAALRRGSCPPAPPRPRPGLRPDDLILYVEGESVPTIKSFRETMKQYTPGTGSHHAVAARQQARDRQAEADGTAEGDGIELKLATGPRPSFANSVW